MKKLLLFSSSFLGAVGLNAQITVNQWDVAAVGKVLHNAHDTLKANNPGAINPGSAGANKTWNFSTLAAHTIDTLTFTNPGWLPNGSKFPNSNLGILQTDGTELYLINSSTGLFIDGAYGDLTGFGAQAVDFNPNEQLAKFSDTYGSSFQNTSYVEIEFPFTQIPGVDSLQVRHTVMKDVMTDAWGTITTPLGAYSSLRHSGKVKTIDSVFAHPVGPPGWVHIGAPYSPTVDSVYHFSWWGNGVGFAILEFDSTRGDSIQNINWLKTVPFVGSVNELATISGLNIFPNPATNQINFEIKNSEITSLEIFDLSGKLIASLPNKNSRTITYNTDALSNGTYFYRSVDVQGKTLNRGKFDVIK